MKKDGIGKIIWEKRNGIGLTQKELAKRVGTSKTWIVKIETGKGNPSLILLKKICKAIKGTLTIT